MSIKGYKVFNADWTCKGFQYKVGETYKLDGDLEICKRGFHFCKKANDCFNYYSFDSRNRVAEIEAIGAVVTDRDKCATDEIKIIREIAWNELLSIVNMGTGNTGNSNTGNRNTGDWNTGDWNKSDFSTGFFSTETQPIYMFNKPTQYTDANYIRCLEGMRILNSNFKNTQWIYSDSMSNEEKVEHPEHKTTGGYLKVIDFKTACKMMWEKLSEYEKEKVKKLPNFDHDVFMEITGIDSDK